MQAGQGCPPLECRVVPSPHVPPMYPPGAVPWGSEVGPGCRAGQEASLRRPHRAARPLSLVPCRERGPAERHGGGAVPRAVPPYQEAEGHPLQQQQGAASGRGPEPRYQGAAWAGRSVGCAGFPEGKASVVLLRSPAPCRAPADQRVSWAPLTAHLGDHLRFVALQTGLV